MHFLGNLQSGAQFRQGLVQSALEGVPRGEQDPGAHGTGGVTHALRELQSFSGVELHLTGVPRQGQLGLVVQGVHARMWVWFGGPGHGAVKNPSIEFPLP